MKKSDGTENHPVMENRVHTQNGKNRIAMNTMARKKMLNCTWPSKKIINEKVLRPFRKNISDHRQSG